VRQEVSPSANYNNLRDRLDEIMDVIANVAVDNVMKLCPASGSLSTNVLFASSRKNFNTEGIRSRQGKGIPQPKPMPSEQKKKRRRKRKRNR
jgi:hypothetical protein